MRAALQTATSILIDRFIKATTLTQNEAGQVELQIDSLIRQKFEILKELPWVYVIEGPALASQQVGARFLVAPIRSPFRSCQR